MTVGLFIAGKSGYVRITDTTDWALAKWRYKPRAKILPRNTFIANGKDTSISGFVGADVTLEGPYDVGMPAPLVVGHTYAVFLGIDEDTPAEFTLTVRVADMDISNDAEDGPMWVVSAVSHGDFEPTVPQEQAP